VYPNKACPELYDQLQAVADSLPAPIFVLDYDGRYVAVFGGQSRSHYDAGQGLVGCYMQDVLPKEKWKLFLKLVRKAIDTGTLQTYDYQLASDEVQMTKNDGPSGPQWFHGRVYPVMPRPGQKPSAVWLAINISEQKNLEERLQRLSEQDDLTGAFNRRYFMRRLESEFQIAKRRKTALSLISLDIDHFKSVNDRFGHIEGDRALGHIVNMIRPQLRDADILARVGGEEFAILCLSTELNEAWSVGERIRQCIEQTTLETRHAPLHMTISLGIAALTPQEAGIHSLLSRADQALYKAKGSGRNCTCLEPAPATAFEEIPQDTNLTKPFPHQD
jgi:diguanylate cyclase (GGDEF)-like protein